VNFFGDIVEKYSILNFMKIRPVGAELFHADRHDIVNSSFLQFFKSV